MRTLEMRRALPVAGSFDVVVAGGGPSGFVAAVAAGRAGARVALIERYGFLGGMATAGLVTPISEFRKNGRRVIGGIPWEFVRRMGELGGAVLDYPIGNVPFDAEVYKLVAQRMAQEAGVRLCLHTALVDVEAADGTVRAAVVTGPEGLCALEGALFIDATGDGALAHAAGMPMQDLPEDAGDLQPATLCFRLTGVDTDRLEKLHPREQNTRYFNDRVAARLLALRAAGVSVPNFGGPWFCTVLREGVVHVNMTRAAARATDGAEVSKAECALREDAFRFAELLREHFDEFRGCSLLMTAAQAGHRESRRLKGSHVLTGEELLSAQRFPDAIARSAHPVDIHHAGDNGQSVRFLEEAGYIPYRSLVAKGFDNVIVTGRCVSADRVALASIRVQAPAMAMGQAAGCAAALCVRGGYPAWDAPVARLREALTAQGALLEEEVAREV